MRFIFTSGLNNIYNLLIADLLVWCSGIIACPEGTRSLVRIPLKPFLNNSFLSIPVKYKLKIEEFNISPTQRKSLIIQTPTLSLLCNGQCCIHVGREPWGLTQTMYHGWSYLFDDMERYRYYTLYSKVGQADIEQSLWLGRPRR